jgi:hypothetical protein
VPRNTEKSALETLWALREDLTKDVRLKLKIGK